MRKLCSALLLALATSADRWVHFHRFEARWLCDAMDRLSGVPRAHVRQHRLDGSPSHYSLAEMRSRLVHPSQQVPT